MIRVSVLYPIGAKAAVVIRALAAAQIAHRRLMSLWLI